MHLFTFIAGYGGILSSCCRRAGFSERKTKDEGIGSGAGEDSKNGAVRQTKGTTEQGELYSHDMAPHNTSAVPLYSALRHSTPLLFSFLFSTLS